MTSPNRDDNGRINIAAPLWIQQPWLDEVLTGRKTVEGRVLGRDRQSKWKEGDVVLVGHGPDDPDAQQAVVIRVRYYKSLIEYLENEWQQAAPQCDTLEDAIHGYTQITTTSKGPNVDGAVRGEQILAFGERRIATRGGLVALELDLP